MPTLTSTIGEAGMEEKARMMSRLAINEVSTYRWSFEQDVEAYQAAGVAGIGVWREKISDYGFEKGAELLEESGLAVSSLMWAGGFTGSDGRSFDESLDDAREAIRQASALKAACLIVYSGPRAGHTRNHARRLVRSALEQLAPFAENHGVTLGLEPVHECCSTQWSFLTSLDETLELLGELNSPRIRLVFDTYHLGHDADVLHRLGEIAQWATLIQLGDSRQPPLDEPNRCALGSGELPLKELISGLRREGYQGYFEVELVGEDCEVLSYEDLVHHARDAFRGLLQAESPL